MKKLFENAWVTLGCMLAVSLVDLIALRSIDFGAGFVLSLLFFAGFLLYKPKGNEVS